MGTGIAMIDLHFGHLAHDSREHAVSLLDALALERAVDAGWARLGKPADPVQAPFPDILGRDRGSPWTLGGRRGARSSSPP
jgi:hypothetical protein